MSLLRCGKFVFELQATRESTEVEIRIRGTVKDSSEYMTDR